MLGALPEQRKCSRVYLPIRATVAFPDLGIDSNTALLRDMNMLGAFFYCKQRPSVGCLVNLNFDLSEEGDGVKVLCEGRVVRVEEFTPGGAIGVATEFTRYELSRPVRAEQDRKHLHDGPFIGWTMEMVERVFERATARLNTECSQAA
jgi:hypothetical protein